MDSKRPNVLMIMCDQLNPGVLSCYGGPLKAPNIERLASEGIVFDNMTCTTPICTPSRASIITGLYPHNHGIVGNVWKNEYPWFKGVPATEESINEGDMTTEKILHMNGYKTYHFVKWHLKGDDDLSYYPRMYREHYEYAEEMTEKFEAVRRLPRDRWLDWYGWALPVSVPDGVRSAVAKYEKNRSNINVHPFAKQIGLLEMDSEDTFDCRVAHKTINCLKELKDNDNRSIIGSEVNSQPFMITCSFNAPHDPNVLPYPFYGMVSPDEIVLPGNFSSSEAGFDDELSRNIVKAFGVEYVKEFLSIYYSSVLMIDHYIGQVLDVLDEEGYSDNTIVVFVSDHGDMSGGHGMVWKSTSAFYEEIARQTALIRFPENLKAGRCDAVASAADIMPTLLDLCGFEIPAHVDGISLVPFITGQTADGGQSRYVLCERIDWNREHTRRVCPGTPASFMLKGSKWKYIKYHNGHEYMYNLADDPGETRNLSGIKEYENRRNELAEILAECLKDTSLSG